MTLTTTFYPVDGGGTGYEITSDDGTFHVRQDYTPGAQGNQPMTPEEAQSFAAEVVAINASIE